MVEPCFHLGATQLQPEGTYHHVENIVAGQQPFNKCKRVGDHLQSSLCNTSSANATFLSNHTLRYIVTETNEIIRPLLDLNRRNDKKEGSVKDFDMLSFFEWEFKCLPMVVNWLERASECEMPDGFKPNIEQRKLSTINSLSEVCHC